MNPRTALGSGGLIAGACLACCALPIIAALLLGAAALFVVGTSIEGSEVILIAAGVALSIAAAAVVVLVHHPTIYLGVAVFAGVFGLLDLREALHGLRENEAVIGIIALVIAFMHLGAAALAWRLSRHNPSVAEA